METALKNTQSNIYSSCKDSGIIWLEKIPSHWQSKPFFTIGKVISEVNCKDKELLSVYLDKGVIRFSDVTEKRTNVTSEDLSKYQAVAPGNLVLNNQQAWRGSVGVSKYSGIVSPAYIVLCLSNEIDFDFANYLFRDGTMVSHFLVCSKGVGTIQRNLYWPQLKRANVCLPPLPEQTAIAAFLDRKTALIDQAIDIKQNQIELLKERSQILIHKAVTRGLNPNVKMKDSGVEWIGEIPEGWEVKRLKYVANIVYGISPHEKTYNDLGEGSILVNGPAEYSETDFGYTRAIKWTTAPSKFAKKGSLLFCLRGSTTGRLNICHEDLAVGRGCAAILAKENHNFLIRAVSSLKDRIIETFKGSTFPSITSSDLDNYPIPKPPVTEQFEISGHINNLEIKIATAISLKEQEIEKLKEYKATLINSAVTGKIKVFDDAK